MTLLSKIVNHLSTCSPKRQLRCSKIFLIYLIKEIGLTCGMHPFGAQSLKCKPLRVPAWRPTRTRSRLAQPGCELLPGPPSPRGYATSQTAPLLYWESLVAQSPTFAGYLLDSSKSIRTSFLCIHVSVRSNSLIH